MTALAILLGLAIGVVVGAVGGGGAILALPVLVYVLDEPVGPASTASLVVVAVGGGDRRRARSRATAACAGGSRSRSPRPAAVGSLLGTLASREVSAAAARARVRAR